MRTGSQASSRERRRWRRRIRRLMWTAMVLFVCFLFGRFLLLSWIVAPVAGVALGASVDMSQASCAPTCRLDLSNLRIGDGEDLFIATGPVKARYRLWRTLFIGPYIEKLHATGVTVNLANAPEGKIRLPRFRWFRKRREEDIEEAEPFLLRDLLLESSTIVYEKEGSPLRMRLTDAMARLPELRHGQPGRLEVMGRIEQLDVGPLSISSGMVSGYCEMAHDREMDLQSSEYSFTARDLTGHIGGTSLRGLSVVLTGRTRAERGNGMRQDVSLQLMRGDEPLGLARLDGWYTKSLARLDLTARVDVGAELTNQMLLALGLPSQPDPSLGLAARIQFPEPGVGELTLACTAMDAGETILDLDVTTRSPLPPVLRPARVRVSGERLAIDRLLAIYDDHVAEAEDVPDAGSAMAQPTVRPLPAAAQDLLARLSLPPVILDLDLRNVSYGTLQGDVSATARVQDHHATLDPCSVAVADGTIQAVVGADWANGSPACEGRVQMDGVDLEQLSSALIDQEDGKVSGRVDSLDLAFQTSGSSSQDLLAELDGSIKLSLGNLRLEDLKSLRESAREYRLDGLRHLAFDQGTVNGRVQDGKLVLEEGRLAGESGRLDLTGSVGLVDQEMALTLDAGLGDDLRRQFARVPRYGYLAMLLQPRDGYAYLPAPVPLRGTLSDPKFDLARLFLGATKSAPVQEKGALLLRSLLDR